MGADMLVTGLWIDEDTDPDWGAAKAQAQTLRAEELADPDLHFDCSSEAAFRADLLAAVDEAEKVWSELPRDVATISLRGAHVVLTGGLSWGDAPTDSYEAIDRFLSAEPLWRAAGFEG